MPAPDELRRLPRGPLGCCSDSAACGSPDDEPDGSVQSAAVAPAADQAPAGDACLTEFDQHLCAQVKAMFQRHRLEMRQRVVDCLDVGLARQEQMLQHMLAKHFEMVGSCRSEGTEFTSAATVGSTEGGATLMPASYSTLSALAPSPKMSESFTSVCTEQCAGMHGQFYWSGTGSTSVGSSSVVPLVEEEAKRREDASKVQVEAEIKSSAWLEMDWLARLERFTSSSEFHFFTGIVIITNSVFIGIEVQYRATHDQSGLSYFNAFQYAYGAFFFIEILLRLCGQRWQFFHSELWAWNCFDLLLVILSVVEVIVEIMRAARGVPEGVSSAAFEASNLRIARLIRIIRSIRIARVVEFIGALRTLIHSLVCTLRTLVWAILLLVMIIYIAAVVFTEAGSEYVHSRDPHGSDDEELVALLLKKYWGSVGRSMITLFQAISGGVDWEFVARPLEDIHWTWFFLFVCYIAFTLFAALNVITAVFCQAAIESAEHDQGMVLQSMIANKKMYEEQITRLFNDIDRDGSGFITLTELEYRMRDQGVQASLTSLDIDIEDAWTLFKFLDSDGTHRINLEKFVLGCLRLKGKARSSDMMQLMEENRWMMKQLVSLTRMMESVASAAGFPRRSRSDMVVEKSLPSLSEV